MSHNYNNDLAINMPYLSDDASKVNAGKRVLCNAGM